MRETERVHSVNHSQLTMITGSNDFFRIREIHPGELCRPLKYRKKESWSPVSLNYQQPKQQRKINMTRDKMKTSGDSWLISLNRSKNVFASRLVRSRRRVIMTDENEFHRRRQSANLGWLVSRGPSKVWRKGGKGPISRTIVTCNRSTIRDVVMIPNPVSLMKIFCYPE